MKSMARNKSSQLAIVILAAVLPGTDPFRRMLMAGPVYLLYEISVWVAKMVKPRGYQELETEPAE